MPDVEEIMTEVLHSFALPAERAVPAMIEALEACGYRIVPANVARVGGFVGDDGPVKSDAIELDDGTRYEPVTPEGRRTVETITPRSWGDPIPGVTPEEGDAFIAAATGTDEHPPAVESMYVSAAQAGGCLACNRPPVGRVTRIRLGTSQRTEIRLCDGCRAVLLDHLT